MVAVKPAHGKIFFLHIGDMIFQIKPMGAALNRYCPAEPAVGEVMPMITGGLSTLFSGFCTPVRRGGICRRITGTGRIRIADACCSRRYF